MTKEEWLEKRKAYEDDLAARNKTALDETVKSAVWQVSEVIDAAEQLFFTLRYDSNASYRNLEMNLDVDMKFATDEMLALTEKALKEKYPFLNFYYKVDHYQAYDYPLTDKLEPSIYFTWTLKD